MKRLVLALSVALALAGSAGAAQAQNFVIVVNASNPATEVTPELASRLFLKKVRRWSNGDNVVPIDQQATSSVRQAFSLKVHGRSTAAVHAYWQQQIFAGNDLPPMEKSGDEQVLAFVRSNPAAVGYVNAGTPLIAGTKALRLAGR